MSAQQFRMEETMGEELVQLNTELGHLETACSGLLDSTEERTHLIGGMLFLIVETNKAIDSITSSKNSYKALKDGTLIGVK